MAGISHAKGKNKPFLGEATKARMFLAVACFWPIFVLLLFAASAPQLQEARANPRQLLDRNNELNKDLRFKFRKVLDRVDIMGYGPTHPRVAVVIVGDDSQKILTTVESVFRHTALERIFLVCVVVDGRESDQQLVKELEKIDEGAVPHWHGLRADIHLPGESNADDKAAHGSRIQVLFNAEAVGVSESRGDAVQFIHLLASKHENTGIKSPQEDLLLLLMDSGTQFSDKEWLAPVTGALIVPPPLIGSEEKAHLAAMKLANAVVFNTEGAGKRMSFDTTFKAIVSDASAEDINRSDGMSYPTPVWNGAAIAMRLDTYRNLPAQDISLTEAWPANLELSLNLWLCADGMDMLRDLTATAPAVEPNPLSPEMAARFSAAWMDDQTWNKFFHAYSKTHTTLTHLEWETLMSKARSNDYFPIDLTERCRSFSWYAENINTDITEALSQAEREIKEEKKKQKEEENLRIMERAMKQQQEQALEKKKQEEEAAAAAAAAAAQGAEGKPDGQPEGQPEEGKPEEGKHEEGNPEEGKPDEGHPEEGKPEEGKPEEGKPEEGKPEEGKPEEGKPEEGKPEEGKPEEGKPEGQPGEGNEQAVERKAEEQPAADGDGSCPKPQVPLRPNNLEIVSKATPTEINYVDVSGGHAEHPHLGAKDEDGNFGYIHDEKALRNNPPAEMNFGGAELEQACRNRDNHWRMLHEKVRVDLKAHEEAEQSGRKRDKIFCLVYTIESGHSKIPKIRETWGPKCDGFMVGSTKTDKALGTVEIPHEGPEEYNNIWQKVRSMWSYIYDNYYEEYDWFHIGGDDLFLIVENLRLYLESEEIKTAQNGGICLPSGEETKQTPLFLGRRFAYQGHMDDIFISGGSGYTMNKASLKLLVTEGFPNYWPHAHTFSEDTMVAKELRKFNIFPYDTKDENGGERYMPFAPGHHYGYRLPADIENSKDWYAHYSIDIKEGVDHCSAQSVAFHYIKDNMMYRLYSLLYGKCPPGTAE